MPPLLPPLLPLLQQGALAALALLLLPLPLRQLRGGGC